MKSNEVRDWAITGVCICLMFILIGVGSYTIGWCRGISHFLGELQEAAGSVPVDVHNIALDVNRDAQIAGGAENAMRKAMLDLDKQTLPKANDLLDAASGSVKAAGDLERSVKAKVDDLDTKPTLDKLDAAIDAITTMPPHINQAVDNLAEATDTANGKMAELDPTQLNMALHNGAQFLAEGASFIHKGSDFLFPPKYTGKHPFWHGAGQIAMKQLGLATEVGESMYYWSNVK